MEQNNNLSFVKTDGSRIQQILYNVLEFAYCNNDSKEIKIITKEYENSLKLKVLFQGCEENLIHYHSVFSDDHYELGNGLGINVARKILLMQDGDLSIKLNG